MSELGNAYVQIIPSMRGIKGNLEKELGDAGESAGKSSGSRFGAALKSAIGAASSGIASVVSQSLAAGADLQQSFGGLETIYGDAAEQAKVFAVQASQMGVSANEYAEQAVSFGAALKMAFGGDTTKAVEAANTAIMDMTDNAAKMGTPLESIQAAYQGFSKGQYQLLDNLKLGYGGSKEEMERLLADAQKISGVEYNLDNLGDVYDAIHVIQGELGLTGVAAEEASTTFSGSLGAMKAAATNVLGNLALGEDIGPSLEVLSNSVQTFLTGNLFPMISTIISTLPGAAAQLLIDLAPALIPAGMDLIVELMTGLADTGPDLLIQVAEMIPDLVDTLTSPNSLTQLIEAGVKLLTGLISAIPIIIPRLIQAIPTIVSNIFTALSNSWPTIKEAGKEMLGGLLKAIPEILTSALKALWNVGSQLVQGLWNGIKDAKDWVLNKIKGFGSSILSGIKSIFGIHSPSTEMMWMGEMLDRGLANGITGGLGEVENAMGMLSATTLSGIDPRINVGGGSAGRITNMGGVSFAIYAAPGQDVEELADIMMEKMQQVYDKEEVALA